MQPGMLARLQQRMAAEKLTNFEVIKGRFGEGLLGKDQYDLVFLVSVLGEIPDQQGALEEIHQALIPGGLLSITEVLPDPHFQSQAAVTRLAEMTGFEATLVKQGWRSYTMNLKKH
jgi:ubiquinone/menaquinone biosynthesis C-methylase UbiE